jgi:hypothetical protein
VATRYKLPSSSTRRRVRLGRARPHLPATEAAWLDGAVGEAQVAVLARARSAATEETMGRDEEMLVDEAEPLRFESFARVLAYWWHHADPDGVEADACRRRDSRRVHLSQSFGGAGSSTGCWTPSPGRWSTTPCVASNKSCSRPTEVL